MNNRGEYGLTTHTNPYDETKLHGFIEVKN